MTFLKTSIAALLVACLSAQAAVPVIPVGGLCSGIAGPVKDQCATGSTCCTVSPDRSVCAEVADGQCPEKFIPEGGLCAGFAGPVGFPCIPTTKCCYLYADNARCIPSADKCPLDWTRK